jgi:hypothetical protein
VERVAFLIEETGVRLGCLLNPEDLEVRRVAGVQARRSGLRPLSGSGLTDDALIFTGGGQTELELKLLFDLSLEGSSIQASDVRDLTRPLWELSENVAAHEGPGRPPAVRFVWGKAWNVLGVVVSVAERLEQFTQQGAPQRSWLRMRLLRVPEPVQPPVFQGGMTAPEMKDGAFDLEHLNELDIPEDQVFSHEVIGDVDSSERIDEVAWKLFSRPSMWKIIAAFNGVMDPLSIEPGTVLRAPFSLSGIVRAKEVQP